MYDYAFRKNMTLKYLRNRNLNLAFEERRACLLGGVPIATIPVYMLVSGSPNRTIFTLFLGILALELMG